MDPRLAPTEVFDTYWRFAAERQAVYLRRREGQPAPWTDDPILGRYRFTNPYRAADRVSQYLIREVQYRTDRSQEPAEVIFRTLLFKIFNKIETWEDIEREVGPVSWQGFNPYRVEDFLDHQKKAGVALYSAAYIMPSPMLDRGTSKHRNHLKLLDLMMMNGLTNAITSSTGLKDIYDAIVGFPGMGPFLAFQYAIDLNYSGIVDHGEDDFVVPGPGALDGISKCFSDLGGMTPTAVIMDVTQNQASEFARLGIDFPGLFGRPLQPIDCQNLFCEISKYARVAHPEVAGVSGRTQIKQTYRQLLRPLPPPMFPPRWKLDIPPYAPLPEPSGFQATLF